MLKMIGVAVAVLVGLVVITLIVGYLLPVKHAAARAISLHQKSEAVFALITDFPAAVSWRKGLQSVEMLRSENGRTCFREKGPDGTITFEVLSQEPPNGLITQIADKKLPFGGAWIFDITPTAEGCRLNITEQGEVYNPVFRVVSRFFLGYTRTLDAYLDSVAAKFGEKATIVPGQVAPRPDGT
jgi:hypothetical protein